MIDHAAIIAAQLAVRRATVFRDAQGRATTLQPVQFVPPLDDESQRVSLDGDWAVMKWPFARPEQSLVAARARDGRWPRVTQPGPVFYLDPEQNPATIPNWNRVGLDHLHPEDGAVLRRTVRLPRSWRGCRVYLRFDAIYPAGRVYLDGVLLGEHTSGLTPVEWDVTDRVRPGGEHLVAVRLLRKHPFVRLDMPRHALEFTGLAQSAYFHATGPVEICGYHLITSLAADLRRGAVAGTVQVRNHRARPVTGRVAVTVTSPAGARVATATYRTACAAGAGTDVAVDLPVARPQLWNDEFPRLYRVTLTLTVGGEKQTVSYATGFRRLDLSPAGPRLNGNPVKFRGVNHLTFHPQTGLYTPRAWLHQCLTLMKRANVNAIRTHFLAPPAVADLCDELGIYLLQELPIDWGTNYIHDVAWVGPILQRLHGGVLRDRHHPSLMVWSVGNENLPETAAVAADGWNHLRLADRFVKTLDPTRPTMFPPPGPANKVEYIFELRVGDIADTHYSFKGVRQLRETGCVRNPVAWDGTMEETTREQALARGWTGVWFSSEYGLFNLMPDLLNAPYQSIISDRHEDLFSGKNTLQVFVDRLRDEWNEMRKDPTCLGGAYFPWLCAGAGRNPWGWVRWGEDADWGVVTADLQPKPFFWALRVLFSPVIFSHDRVRWRPGQTEIQIELWNQYNAIHLRDCTLRTMMGGGGQWMGLMREWQDVPVAAAPGERVTVTIPIWNEASRRALEAGLPICCRCFLLDPTGFRTLTHDILVIPEQATDALTAMPIGPDAVFA